MGSGHTIFRVKRGDATALRRVLELLLLLLPGTSFGTYVVRRDQILMLILTDNYSSQLHCTQPLAVMIMPFR